MSPLEPALHRGRVHEGAVGEEEHALGVAAVLRGGRGGRGCQRHRRRRRRHWGLCVVSLPRRSRASAPLGGRLKPLRVSTSDRGCC